MCLLLSHRCITGHSPLLTGTPDALRELIKDQAFEIVELQPGETLD